MDTLATFHIAHLPTEITVYIALYRGLKNASFLRQQLLDGNADFEYAFVDATSVRSLVSEGCTLSLTSLDPIYDPCFSRRFQGRKRHAEPTHEVTQRTFRDSLCIKPQQQCEIVPVRVKVIEYLLLTATIPYR